MTKTPFWAVVDCANYLVETRVSVKRIERFLVAEEIKEREFEDNYQDDSSDHAIKIVDKRFKWKKDDKRAKSLHLKTEIDKELGQKDKARNTDRDALEGDRGSFDEADDSIGSISLMNTSDDFDGAKTAQESQFVLEVDKLVVDKGDLVVVFGESSSGKSSLLYAIINEMVDISPDYGDIETNGNVAFMSQNTWLVGDTIQENICLGSDYDEDWMHQCLRVSELDQDLKAMNHGLQTILSDTSDSVSGGQKARIALARCFYQK